MTEIKYPYIPEGKVIHYVDVSNPYMALAKKFARQHSLDAVMPGAAVVAKDGIVIGMGANGSDYHQKHACQRVTLGCKSGEGYELCEGCHPKNHSEPSAIRDALARGNDPKGADLYLWGHWWCCEPCWNAMAQAGIRRVFLLERSEILFNKEHPDNVVGRQFEMMAKPKEGRVFGEVFHLSVGAVIRRNGKYLLIDRAKPPYGFAGIAGHIDEGEGPYEALAREIREESGLTLKDSSLHFEETLDGNVCRHGVGMHHWFLYVCTASGEIARNILETKSIGWYTAEEMQKLPLEPVWEYWFRKLDLIVAE